MFIIINQNNDILHSNGYFYGAFFTGCGCNYCSYKHRANAENRIKKIFQKYPNMKLDVKEIK